MNNIHLSPTARATFVNAAAQGEPIGVPAICIVEIIYLVEKGRIPAAAFTLLQEALHANPSALTVVALNDTIAYQVQAINRANVPDMPDRIIAATALHYSLPLISQNGKIRTSGITTLW